MTFGLTHEGVPVPADVKHGETEQTVKGVKQSNTIRRNQPPCMSVGVRARKPASNMK